MLTLAILHLPWWPDSGGEQNDELLPPLLNQRYSSRFFNSQGTEPVVLINPLIEASSLLRITVEKVIIDCN